MRIKPSLCAICAALYALPHIAAANEPPPILAAIIQGDLKRVNEILDSSPDVLHQGLREVPIRRSKEVRVKDVTPLAVAAEAGHPEVVMALLERGANVNSGLEEFPTASPLHLAVRSGHGEVVGMLLDKGAKIEAEGDINDLPGPRGRIDEVTPLSHAVLTCRSEIVKLLLDRGANVATKDRLGWTPMHFAAHVGSPEIVEMLHAKGGAEDARTLRGERPIDLAAQRHKIPATRIGGCPNGGKTGPTIKALKNLGNRSRRISPEAPSGGGLRSNPGGEDE